jgi:phosphoglycolate phosphatase
VKRSVGWGDKNFVARFVKKRDLVRALRFYRSHHTTSLVRHSKVLPHSREVLTTLKREGCALAVASNRPEKFSGILLRHLKLQRYFDLVVCAKNKDDIKPKPNLLLRVLRALKIDRAEALYVGDMVIDVRAGRNAGIRTIAIIGGSSSATDLRRARPFKVISKLSSLVPLVRKENELARIKKQILGHRDNRSISVLCAL